jgi:hypothetical protein
VLRFATQAVLEKRLVVFIGLNSLKFTDEEGVVPFETGK